MMAVGRIRWRFGHGQSGAGPWHRLLRPVMLIAEAPETIASAVRRFQSLVDIIASRVTCVIVSDQLCGQSGSRQKRA